MANAKCDLLKQAAERELREVILPFWLGRAVDLVRGGFHGRVDSENQPVPDAPRGDVLNARLVWTFSAVSRILGDPILRAYADRAYHYYREHFVDPVHGGVWWTVNADGSVRDDFKHVYSNGFALYAFSEYYRATGEPQALEDAWKIFRLLEERAWQPECGGYFEDFSRDWTREVELPFPHAAMSMNTTLHILEPCTNFYRVAPTPETRAALVRLIDIFLEKIIDPADGHFRTHFDRNWNSVVCEHSYGHEIEGSWLLKEAAEALGDPEVTRRVDAAWPRVVRASYEGRTPDGSMIYEFHPDTGKRRTARAWWVQAELVIGSLNAWQFGMGDSYLDDALETMNYITGHLSDRRNGEWFHYADDFGVPCRREDKASHWKCPYHNSRMCLEVMTRLSEQSGERPGIR